MKTMNPEELEELVYKKKIKKKSLKHCKNALKHCNIGGSVLL